MKVFMSWSGQRSKLTAELLHDWIKCVIQAAQPWISSKGIERGALWFSEINNELKDTAVGVICLTQENKNAPWILFEAGALAKGLSTNRVCTLLVDISPSDLQPPLAQFNHTFPDKESMWSLITTLNNGLEGSRLDPTVLRRVFDTYWPQFETQFATILAENPPETVIVPRQEKDILAEILETTRSMSHRVRSLEQRNNINSHVSNPWAQQEIATEISISTSDERAHKYALAVMDAKRLIEQGIPSSDIYEFLKINYHLPRTRIKNLLNSLGIAFDIPLENGPN